MHGDDDPIVPYDDSAPLSARLVQNRTLKTCKGFPHGMPTTQAGTIDADPARFRSLTDGRADTDRGRYCLVDHPRTVSR
ncbi:MAG TPA: hypothetical protein VME22_10990 [Solirubrobacteraceae bacterium]|nr:hypothetical protein [Solirubrobacteraceae bacterium]